MSVEADPSDPISSSGFTRRDFLMTVLATGFATAVRPICADTAIVTGTEGLIAGEVKIPVEGGEIPAYRVMPANGASFPIVVVVQEIFGVHEHIKDVCRRLAKLGYLAIAPELYARQGDVSVMTDKKKIIGTVVSKVPDAQVMGDIDAAVLWAKKSSKGDDTRLGITGFCWGGRIVWMYAAHNPNVKAAVAWYGRLDRAGPWVAVGEDSELQPKNPLDVAASIKPPVLGLYGGADRNIPLENIERMRAALKAAGSRSEIIVYPDTPHAFHADYRPSYRKEAAEDGWKRLQAWFKTHGVI